GRTMLFGGEACAKGTAMVANLLEDAMRDPRSQRAGRGGSSGGRARITVSRRTMIEICAQNPKSGAGPVRSTELARSPAEQSAKVVETTKTQSAGTGHPARAEELSARTLPAIEDAEGERNPMRGGSTHWARPGRDGPSWMSTGRPRVMR